MLSFPLIALLLATPTPPPVAAEAFTHLQAPPVAAEAFTHLQAIAGQWEAPDKGVRVSYQLVANGSTLLETYITPRGTTTLTVFHLDNDRLVATHYCAQGNQPRLVLSAANATARSFTFDFWDATNLKSPGQAHLRHLELEAADADHTTRRETYVENGKDDSAELKLVRVK